MTNNRGLSGEQQAKKFWQTGVQELLAGRIHAAVCCCNESLEECPTAEGYTFRGWALSYLGMLDYAIEDCKRAIEIDPDFGNPYNDIGVYLMRMGLLDDAIPWLQEAKLAKRYEPRHFPYINLGRIYIEKGNQSLALEEFVHALDLDPENPTALKGIADLELHID